MRFLCFECLLHLLLNDTEKWELEDSSTVFLIIEPLAEEYTKGASRREKFPSDISGTGGEEL